MSAAVASCFMCCFTHVHVLADVGNKLLEISENFDFMARVQRGLKMGRVYAPLGAAAVAHKHVSGKHREGQSTTLHKHLCFP